VEVQTGEAPAEDEELAALVVVALSGRALGAVEAFDERLAVGVEDDVEGLAITLGVGSLPPFSPFCFCWWL